MSLEEKVIKFMPKDYRKLMVPPLLLVIFSIYVLFSSYAQTGSFLDLGIEFTGGTQASIYTTSEINLKTIETAVKEGIDKNAVVRLAVGNTGQTVIIESKNELKTADIKPVLDKAGIKYTDKDISMVIMGASAGESFFREAQIAIILAFLSMAIVVFLTFKDFIPSVAVVSAAIIDIVFAMAMMNVVGIELSLGTLASLLMLVGYSIDTDILLTSRVLKRSDEGDIDDRIWSSIKTGIMMTLTAMASLVVLYVVSISPVIDQLALVILFGLIADVISTWFGNVAILRWYLERRNK